ncbi:virulence factor Mce [Mycolicibacterium murale]|jgi:phospholipid/cholesterol/gamma-HCH transport system substrate-binding protein|uniref:Virulence factor Mce n=1 Tax=Mycolicibacterium murale TaxID=182220 RepID=A0A7I9WNQ3_9MYCO|nr:MlaD family protein [Mycolicibacterium murale]MCV7180459.1 MCE family protein [Mycolicibacterium murale]GFG59354.1 virulence factor Mce [Mycolicibacterium murale]
MLTRFIRIQLVLFTISALVAMGIMVIGYLQAPTLFGLGRITVTVQLEGTGGLYRFANVTYRGVEMGKVTDVRPTRDGAEATLSLQTAPRVPADLRAVVRSVSAVGEQYVDLQPETDSGPYLEDGSVIAMAQTSIPQAVGPMLDRASALLDSVPKDRIPQLLDESFAALDGAAYDLGSLFDSSSTVITDANNVADQMKSLIDDSRPLLDGQAQSTDQIRTWAAGMAGITGQLVDNDPQIRTLLERAPGAADEASRLFNAVKPTMPVLLANLTSVGQVAVAYHASLEQLLVLLPPFVAATQTVGVARNNPTGMAMGDFTLAMNDPPACTVGFLPPSSWRSPDDLSDIDTPDGLYCKLPQDSPIAVRGARNYPCMEVPGKRAATVEQCSSDKPFEPLAMRQHSLGPYPIDPGLIAQGIPPDDRVDFSDQIYGPVGGTPMPPPAPAPEPPPPAPVPAAPAAFAPAGAGGPSVAIATYDPATGQYATPQGQVFRQADLAPVAQDRSWQDLLPTG